MAFRKCDLNERHVCFAPGHFAFSNEEIQINPVQQGDKVIQFVELKYMKSSEISKQTLDPGIITLESMLAAGVTLDPGQSARMLNLSDPVDLEQRSAQMSENLYKVLLENEYLKPTEE